MLATAQAALLRPPPATPALRRPRLHPAPPAPPLRAPAHGPPGPGAPARQPAAPLRRHIVYVPNF